MEISIIGGGITGLTTALALRKMGLEATVYERTPVLNEVGAGILMQPNAMHVLRWLGIADKVKESGYALDRMDISNAQLVPFRNASPGLIRGEQGEKVVAIHRARLQSILYESLPTGVVQLGVPYQSHRAVNGGLEVDHGERKSTATIILGADGINSKVRASLFPEATKRFSGQTCWRGIATMAIPAKIDRRGFEAWGGGYRFGFTPISEREIYWFAVAQAEENEGGTPFTSHAPLLDMFGSFHSLVSEIISSTPVEKIIWDDLHDLGRLGSWSQGNVCLLGDAAHATTPNMGQGAGQGIEDGYCISQALAQNPDPQQAFKEFEAGRRKKVDYVVNNSWRFGKMAHSASGRWIMKTLMRIMPERAVKKQMEKLFQVQGLSG